jgi:hypothetical protein
MDKKNYGDDNFKLNVSAISSILIASLFVLGSSEFTNSTLAQNVSNQTSAEDINNNNTGIAIANESKSPTEGLKGNQTVNMSAVTQSNAATSNVTETTPTNVTETTPTNVTETTPTNVTETTPTNVTETTPTNVTGIAIGGGAVVVIVGGILTIFMIKRSRKNNYKLSTRKKD